MSRLLRVSVWVSLALLTACAQPQLVRNGTAVPYETAAAVDLAESRQAISKRDFSTARARLERFRSELPRSRRLDEALYLLGGVNEQLDRRESAAAVWRELVERHPRSRFAPESALRAARIYRDLGRFEAGHRLLASSRFDSAEASVRVKLNRLQGDLARALGDYPDAVIALAHARRDVSNADELRELDLELEELIDSRIPEAELFALAFRLPRGSVYDRVNLTLASRLLTRGDRDGARAALDRLSGALSPPDEIELQSLLTRLERGLGEVEETLGLAIPLSGPYAPFGESVLRGAVLSLGLYDNPDSHFRVIVRDTGGDVAQGKRAIRELVDAGVSGIIGPLRSSVAESVAPIAEEAAIPMLTLAKREGVALLGDYVFRLGLSVADEARALARYATETAGFQRLAILYPEDEYGTKFKNLFWEAVEEQGGAIVGVEAYQPDSVDWQNEIKKLVGMYYLTDDERERVEEHRKLMKRPETNAEKLEDPRFQGLPPYVDFDALFIPDNAGKVGLILPQLRFYDIREATYLGGSAWNDSELIKIAGREARRSVFVDSFHPQSNSPRVVAFAERFIGTYGDPPDALAADGYDAGELFRQLIESRQGLKREELRSELLQVSDFRGVSGVTSFDETGGTRKDVHLLTVRGGEIQTLESIP